MVLFTDLVGSTERRQRIGEEEADELDRVHLALLADAIEASSGRVVKSIGDGVMATFTGAADVVNAAVAIQQAAERHSRQHPDQPLSIRVGVSCGDVAERDGDVFGTAVVEAARLCNTAQGGQVLVADLVRMLARGRGGHTFESMGALELKGLDEPVPACSVAWERFAVDDGAVLAFPHLLAPPTAVAYTGRLGLLADLHKQWELVRAGEGSRLTLLVGEPGVGKTRTSSELARVAHADGTPVLYGRCDEELALSFQPFVEALDWQTTHGPHLPLGRFGGDLQRLVPEVGARVPDLQPPISSDPQAEEHRLLEAVASWLVTVSRERGLLLVVDDLHWATRPTLQMLVHLVRSATSDPDARLLVIGTYRDTDIDRTHPLSSVLGDLRRFPNMERLDVAPLSEGEVMDLVALAAGHELDEGTRELARRAYAETEGNPFFVGEVLRHFVEVGAVRFEEGRWSVASLDNVDVPEGVRDVVGRRLDRLSDDAGAVLTAAAIIGREFTLEVVAVVAELGVDHVVDVLDEALRARLIEETGGDRFRFSHALTRQTLVEEVSSTRRRRLHRRVVAALERYRPGDLSALSHHAVEAGPVGGDLSDAIRYTLAAGEQALAARAVGDALVYFGRVFELVDETVTPRTADRRRARCGLGEAQRDAGDPAYRETLFSTTREALHAGEVDLAVRAAISNGRIIMSSVGAVDPQRVEQLEVVLDALGDDTGPDGTVLLAQLAAELASDQATIQRRVELAGRALAHLDELADPAREAEVALAVGISLEAPDYRASTADLLRRSIRAADVSADPNLRAHTRRQAAWHIALDGHLEEAGALLRESRTIAEEAGSPSTRWMSALCGAQVHGWKGDFEEVRRVAQYGLSLGEETGAPDVISWFIAVESGIHSAAGTLGDVADAAGMMADQFPQNSPWRAFHAYALCGAGRFDEAREIVQAHGVDSPDLLAAHTFSYAGWGVQALALSSLGMAEAAGDLASSLAPHRAGWASNGVWVYLPLRLPLAACLRTAGRAEAAAAEAAEGWRTLVDSGVRCSLPWGATVAAPILRSSADPAMRELADNVLVHGLREAEAMGFERRIEELARLRT